MSELSVHQFYYKNNRLQQLRGFYHTASLGSVSKAAEVMSLCQSTISTQIKSLERDLSVSLFERKGPKLTLTAAGDELFKMAIPMIEGMDNLFETFLDERRQLQQKTIYIAANQISVVYLLPKIIKKFVKKYPSIKIVVRDMTPDRAQKALLEEEVDIVFGSYIKIPDTLKYTIIKTYDTVLLVKKTHPIAKMAKINLDDLSQYNLIRIAPHLITVPLFESTCARYKLSSNIEFTAGDWIMLKAFIRADIGYCIISSICIEKHDTDICVRKLNKYFGPLDYGYLTKKGKRQHKAVRDFIDLI